jgi:hypothetical protein
MLANPDIGVTQIARLSRDSVSIYPRSANRESLRCRAAAVRRFQTFPPSQRNGKVRTEAAFPSPTGPVSCDAASSAWRYLTTTWSLD